jgi:hypothetical protein
LTPNVTALSAMTGFCGTALPNIVIGVCAQAVTAGNKLRRRQEACRLKVSIAESQSGGVWTRFFSGVGPVITRFLAVAPKGYQN